MDQQEIRMQMVDLVMRHSQPDTDPAQIVKAAAALEQFVWNGAAMPVPAAGEGLTASEMQAKQPLTPMRHDGAVRAYFAAVRRADFYRAAQIAKAQAEVSAAQDALDAVLAQEAG